MPSDELVARFVSGPATAPERDDFSSAETFCPLAEGSATSPLHPSYRDRLWKELSGAALVPPPLDDLRDNFAAYRPELGNALITAMRSSGFDLWTFLASVMKSDDDQMQASSSENAPGGKQVF